MRPDGAGAPARCRRARPPIVTVLSALTHFTPLLTQRTTVYVPRKEYACIGLRNRDAEPSPNSQVHTEAPVEVSVNCTSSPWTAFVGE